MKKILVFSLGPIFKNHVHGGSQKVLREVSIGLGGKGHEVNIYCVEREDNNKPFRLSKNVMVFPILKFKQTFPAPYKTSPFNLWEIIKILNEQIKKHDVFYIHDAGLNLYEFSNKEIPTIISLRDFLYPETLLGAFNFRRDKIIVNSLHTSEGLKYSVKNFLPDIEERIEIIENGINLNLFKRVRPKKILKLLEKGLDKKDKVILYPHRPDPSKGIYQSLKIVSILKNKKGVKNIRMLIPHYVDEEITNDLSSHYENILKVAEELGIKDNIIFHKWVPYDLMPEYYSLGDLTLSIGNFIEAFGSNVGLESLACGTPVIMSLVGAQRYTLPKGIVPKFPYGDEDEIVETAFEILDKKTNFSHKKIRKFIEEKFSHQRMLENYEKTIVNAKITPPLKLEFRKNKNDILIIAPWACLTKFGIYSDYEYKYHKVSSKLREIFTNNSRVNLGEIKDKKLSQEISVLIEKGILVYES